MSWSSEVSARELLEVPYAPICTLLRWDELRCSVRVFRAAPAKNLFRRRPIIAPAIFGAEVLSLAWTDSFVPAFHLASSLSNS